MFKKILIANRGEIACRVIKTARRMGIKTVAVYSRADEGALHTQLADEAVFIGEAPAKESYLVANNILDAAKKTGAEAIHPGYGFLSENADFAEACEKADIVFIGPPPSAIRAMGSKSAAKALMEKAKVPVVPGYHGEDQSAANFKKTAEKIGYPVLLKATAGGGGKGMRRVDDEDDLESALQSVKREALSSFADDRVLLEKYVLQPRHIEIQVFADTHDNAVYLFERDCSIQRRHQKVVEEAPAFGMSEAQRKKMGDAAVAAAKAVGYAGAGTVEFIADAKGNFYFMEMNTRLQVEHPVTEKITGTDLVEWQIRVAYGEKLPKKQGDLTITGHAIEVRLYAEDPNNNFLPAIGKLKHLVFPPEDAHVRIDTGVRAGSEISPFYDPMIAKVIVWDKTRDGAAKRLHQALNQIEIMGLTTNLNFLSRTVSHPAFLKGELDTGFIERHADDLMPKGAAQIPAAAYGFAIMNRLLQESAADGWKSPWGCTGGFRLGGRGKAQYRFIVGEKPVDAVLEFLPNSYHLLLPQGGIAITASRAADGGITLQSGADKFSGKVIEADGIAHIFSEAGQYELRFDDPLAQSASGGDSGHLRAPMPGKIIQVFVAPNQKVDKGQPLIVLEAMKMEHTIKAPVQGLVKEIYFSAGEQVTEGAELLHVEAEGAAA